MDMYSTARSIREEGTSITPIANAFRTMHHNESNPSYFVPNKNVNKTMGPFRPSPSKQSVFT
jgi:hypothetical protein